MGLHVNYPTMKKVLIIVSVVAGLLCLSVYWLWYGYLPPETPRKVISSFLRQSIPSDWKVKHYRYEWEHLIHDGILEAVIEIPEEEVANAMECLPKKTFIEGVLPDSEECFARSELSPVLADPEYFFQRDLYL